MKASEEITEKDNGPQILNIAISPAGIRHIVKHQEDTRNGQKNKEKEGQPSEAPSKLNLEGSSSDTHRMQMENDIAKHHQSPVPVIIRIAMTEDGFPDLGFVYDGAYLLE